MSNFIADLYQALKNVPPHYVEYGTIPGINNEKVTNLYHFENDLKKDYVDKFLKNYVDEQPQLFTKSHEKVFAYELYYQWQTIIKSKSGDYENLILNGEIRKDNISKIIENYEQFNNSPLATEVKKVGITNMYFYPDFTLHGGNDNIINQEIIVEVKVNDRMHEEAFKIDFYRLALFQQLYGYKNVVFLIIKIDKDELQKKIRALNTDIVDKNTFHFMLRDTCNTQHFKLSEL